MLEKDIQRKVRDYAERKGWYTRKWASANSKGVPDCIFVSPEGLVIFIEFKSEKGKTTKLQDVEIRKLRRNMAVVFVCNGVELGKKIIDDLELITRGL